MEPAVKLRMGNFRIGDLDPRHLSAEPFALLLCGFALFFTAGWFIVMELGGWRPWVAVALSLAVIAIGLRAAAREKRERDDAGGDEEHA
jgi:hypothetical protein